ncbi:uncharacterized protein N7511_005221 [Penicillium nucicola]|uniref:uncharacterized protein n=1 Tax=Penicillium nucicola TaxID=1850975 RepID=UPI002544E47A|nr:uncharacterized protein N7511_005221 [Penicillium nucicola]KAJ5761839.1 hypothetical protein N7511_005221 [Penicillium nucicola]
MNRPKPRKRFYTDLATVLILLSTFAGAVTLQTQFALPDTCNGSRARALVAYSSQFFLTSPIAVFAIFMCLHGYDDDQIIEAGRHEFIQCQFGLTGIMIIAGFLLLDIATLFTGANYLGPAGTALMGVFVLGTVAWGIEDHLPKVRVGRDDTEAVPLRSVDETDSLRIFLGLDKSQPIPKVRLVSRWSICGLVVLEAVGILTLFGLGIAQTVTASPDGCELM